MNNSAAKVGEIFREAGTAFNKLSEMTLMLQPTDDSPPGGKWSDAEVEMLRGCINRFAVELNKISQHIKNRTMRHLRSLLEMDSGTIQDVSSSPQHLTQQPQPVEENIDSESEGHFNESFVNIFSQKITEPVKEEDLDRFLLHFDPSVVNSMPPFDFMQEDSIPQQPASEFEDLQDSSYERTLQAVPSLISLLDADVNNANLPNPINPTESVMANIGTLHAELPNFGSNLGEATGANSQGVNNDSTNFVTREEHFSLRQAQSTWNYGSSPATNQTMGVPIQSGSNLILYPGSNGQTTSVQASGETEIAEVERVNETPSTEVERVNDSASSEVEGVNETPMTEVERVNESQYSPHATVSSLLTQNTLRTGSFNNYILPNNPFRSVQTPNRNVMEGQNDTQQNNTETSRNIFYPGFFKNHSLFGNSLTSNINSTMPQERPPEVLCPGPFSGVNIRESIRPFGQAPNDELKKSDSLSLCTNLFGNSLYSANPEPVAYFSSVRAYTNEQTLASMASMASSAHRTSGEGDRSRGRSRRRRESRRQREGPVTQESADPIISPPGERTVEPNSRLTRSCRRQTYNNEKPAKKRTCKNETITSAASSSNN